MVRKFLDWFERAPSILSMMFMPLVIVLYLVSIPINYFKSRSTKQ